MASRFIEARRTVAALALCLTAAAGAVAAHAQSNISEAEQRLFMDPHLANLPDKAAVSYGYARTGSLESALEDQVRLQVDKTAEGRHAHVDFLTGQNAFALPDIDAASSNPVILSFLERDVREMERRTGGKANYFRKRVRMALAGSAEVDAITLDLQGRPVEAVRISIRPYKGDPLQGRFPAFVDKAYTFTLSKQVPGMVYEMRTEARDPRAPSGGPPLVVERLVYKGTEP